MTVTKNAPHAALSICCRPLVEAFRRDPSAQSDAALVIGFDESGAPFYRFTRQHGGQLLSAPAAPLVFCPFCGHRVTGADDDARAEIRAAVAYEDEEVTLMARDETLEFDTFIAARASDSGAVSVGR
ncbi:MAG TPA: hypothetical protein VEX60_07690 [Pyrinomonadaceae bacterium]|nr:hypothetical protein [Pyrinomonadaceae bacterium]